LFTYPEKCISGTQSYFIQKHEATKQILPFCVVDVLYFQDIHFVELLDFSDFYTISTKIYSSWHSFLSISFDDIRNEVEFYIVAYIVLSQVKCIE